MGEPENPHFYDSEMFGRVHYSRHQLFSAFEEPRYLKRSKKCSEPIFQKQEFWKAQLWEIRKVGKEGRRTNMKIHLIIFEDLWKWDQYLPEAMKWQFSNTGLLNLWNFDTQKLRNQETSKPRNYKTLETKKPGHFSSKGIPTTPQHTDSHPCTRPPVVFWC